MNPNTSKNASRNYENDVRTQFIRFGLSFLTTNDYSLIQDVLEVKSFLGSIFKGLINDAVSLLIEIFDSLRIYVLSNKSVAKRSKSLFFNTYVLDHISNVYKYYSIENVDIDVSKSIFDFLMDLMCSSSKGILYKSKLMNISFAMLKSPYRSSKHLNVKQSRNRPLIKTLRSLKPSENEDHMKLVVGILSNDSQLKIDYMNWVNVSLDPRLSQTWMNNISFIKKLIQLKPIDMGHIILLFQKEDIDIDENATWFVPAKALNRTTLNQSLLHKEDQIVYETTELIIEIMKVIEEILSPLLVVKSSIIENYSETLSGYIESNVLKSFKKRLPDLQTVLSMLKRYIDKGDNSKETNDEMEVIGEYSESKLQSNILTLISYYLKFFPELFIDAHFDYGRLMPLDIDKFNETVQVDIVEVLMSAKNKLKWSMIIPGSQTSHLNYLLNYMLKNKGNHLYNKLDSIIQSVLIGSGLFEGHENDIKIWIQHMNHDVIEPFEMLLNILNTNPYIYSDMINQLERSSEEVNKLKRELKVDEIQSLSLLIPCLLSNEEKLSSTSSSWNDYIYNVLIGLVHVNYRYIVYMILQLRQIKGDVCNRVLDYLMKLNVQEMIHQQNYNSLKQKILSNLTYDNSFIDEVTNIVLEKCISNRDVEDYMELMTILIDGCDVKQRNSIIHSFIETLNQHINSSFICYYLIEKILLRKKYHIKSDKSNYLLNIHNIYRNYYFSNEIEFELSQDDILKLINIYTIREQSDAFDLAILNLLLELDESLLDQIFNEPFDSFCLNNINIIRSGILSLRIHSIPDSFLSINKHSEPNTYSFSSITDKQILEKLIHFDYDDIMRLPLFLILSHTNPSLCKDFCLKYKILISAACLHDDPQHFNEDNYVLIDHFVFPIFINYIKSNSEFYKEKETSFIVKNLFKLFKTSKQWTIHQIQILSVLIKNETSLSSKLLKYLSKLISIIIDNDDYDSLYLDTLIDHTIERIPSLSLLPKSSILTIVKLLLKKGITNEKILHIIYKISVSDEMIKKRTYYGDFHDMIVSHPLFLSSILENESESYKIEMFRLLHSIYLRTSSKNNVKLLSLYLMAFNASCSISDQYIFKIIQLYEKSGISMSQCGYIWGQVAKEYNIDTNNQFLDTVDILTAGSIFFDGKVISFKKNIRTLRNFPIEKSLKDENPDDIDKIESGEDIYNPSFILPYLKFATQHFPNFDCKKFIDLGCMAIVIMSLSSADEDIRVISYSILTEFLKRMKDSDYKEIRQMRLLLNFLKNSISQIFERLPTFTTSFLAHASLIITRTEHALFLTLNDFLLSRSHLQQDIVPIFISFFLSPSSESHILREWILKVLLASIRQESDLVAVTKYKIIPMLLSHFSSTLSGHESKERDIIISILSKCLTLDKKFKCTIDQGFILWLSNTIKEAIEMERFYSGHSSRIKEIITILNMFREAIYTCKLWQSKVVTSQMLSMCANLTQDSYDTIKIKSKELGEALYDIMKPFSIDFKYN